MTKIPPKTLQEIVQRAVKKYGAPEVAKKLGSSERTVRMWASGERNPSGAAATALLAAYRPKDASTPAATPSVKPLGATLAEAEWLAAQARKALEAAMADADASHRDRASASGALRSALAQVSRLRGEGEISQSAILRSRAWSHVAIALRDALAKYPEAAAAVAEAIERIENPESAT